MLYHILTSLVTVYICLHCSVHQHASHGIVVSEEVQTALVLHQPVVALESTIITHGMPYPHNLEMAVRVEEIIRKEVRPIQDNMNKF